MADRRDFASHFVERKCRRISTESTQKSGNENINVKRQVRLALRGHFKTT